MLLSTRQEQALVRLTTGGLYSPDDRAVLAGLWERLVYRQQVREALDRLAAAVPENRP